MTSPDAGNFKTPFDGYQRAVRSPETDYVAQDFAQLYRNLLDEHVGYDEPSLGKVNLLVPIADLTHWVATIDAKRDYAHSRADRDDEPEAYYRTITLTKFHDSMPRDGFSYEQRGDGIVRRLDIGDITERRIIEQRFAAGMSDPTQHIPNMRRWLADQRLENRDLEVAMALNYQPIPIAEMDELYNLLTRRDVSVLTTEPML